MSGTGLIVWVFFRVLRDHIKKLAKVITPHHPKLSIPTEFLVEAPWWFAQQQILQISAYKTALEKVRCVARCIMSIMNLLSMTSGRNPSADDLTPVLIFVLIKVRILCVGILLVLIVLIGALLISRRILRTCCRRFNT